MIANLAAMLLPALNGAKNRAKTTACQSNLKQIAAEALSYSNDYADWMIPASLWVTGAPDGNTRYPWATELLYRMGKVANFASNRRQPFGQMIKDERLNVANCALFQCPSEPNGIGHYSNARNGGTDFFHYGTYGINDFLTGRDFTSALIRKLTSVKNSAQAIMMMDHTDYGNLRLKDYIHGSAGYKQLATRHGGGVVRELSTSNEYSYCIKGESINVACADGHVENKKRSEFEVEADFSKLFQKGF